MKKKSVCNFRNMVLPKGKLTLVVPIGGGGPRASLQDWELSVCDSSWLCDISTLFLLLDTATLLPLLGLLPISSRSWTGAGRANTCSSFSFQTKNCYVKFTFRDQIKKFNHFLNSLHAGQLCIFFVVFQN